VKHKISTVLVFGIFVLFGTEAGAGTTNLKCGCLSVTQSKIDGTEVSTDQGKIKISCNTKDKYSKTGSSVSVQETNVKVYVDGDNTTQGDNDMNIRFRPRSTTLLSVVDPNNGDKVLWAGTHGDTSYKDIGQFKIKEKDGVYNAAFAAVTGKGTYIGAVLFSVLDPASNKKSMLALCLENK
jgi:hypothetical protein